MYASLQRLLLSRRRSRSPAITTTWFWSRSGRCQKAAVTLFRILQRFAWNRRHILSRGNSLSSLPGRVSVLGRRIWCLSERSKLCANVVSFVWTTVRWNADGPGTARLFHELRLGRNFDNMDQAKPGDFMKIFWSRAVGRNEHGHSTIFLGMENRPDGQYVRYWSSNIPSGYGEKSVPRSKIAYALFSRFETPANLARISSAPFVDTYLASLLRSRSSISEAGAKCGL